MSLLDDIDKQVSDQTILNEEWDEYIYKSLCIHHTTDLVPQYWCDKESEIEWRPKLLSDEYDNSHNIRTFENWSIIGENLIFHPIKWQGAPYINLSALQSDKEFYIIPSLCAQKAYSSYDNQPLEINIDKINEVKLGLDKIGVKNIIYPENILNLFLPHGIGSIIKFGSNIKNIENIQYRADCIDYQLYKIGNLIYLPQLKHIGTIESCYIYLNEDCKNLPCDFINMHTEYSFIHTEYSFIHKSPQCAFYLDGIGEIQLAALLYYNKHQKYQSDYSDYPPYDEIKKYFIKFFKNNPMVKDIYIPTMGFVSLNKKTIKGLFEI